MSIRTIAYLHSKHAGYKADDDAVCVCSFCAATAMRKRTPLMLQPALAAVNVMTS